MQRNLKTNTRKKQNMQRLAVMLWLLCLAVACQAQTPREDFKKNVGWSGGSFTAYPGPLQPKLTPPPGGKRPFYISHYGRHGSRHHTKYEDFDYVLNVLEKARHEGVLTPLGTDVLGRVRRLREDVNGHVGELTELGVSQHRDIVRRMYKRFPEVFKGDVVVDAHSTLAVRCLISMGNALLELQKLNPRLQINMCASQADLAYLSYNDRRLTEKAPSRENRLIYEQFCEAHPTWQRVVSQLIGDTAYVNRYVNGERFNYFLFRLASNVQSVALAGELTLYDLFTEEEIFRNWEKENIYWYMGFGFCPMNGGEQPYSQRILLRTIIEQVDSCLALPRPGATLRYGHDTMLMPLLCLLGVDGYGQSFTDISQLAEKGWLDYRAVPMGGNIQFVFYRKNPSDDDVVFKVLLNENEARLPIATDIAPYYHWSDFRRHYLSLIEAYEASHPED